MANIPEQQGMTMAQKMPLVSIIVPVYQVKEYIGECVESLLAQTYTNLEILLVDDGSTDGSGELCDEYAAKDTRVRVIQQENRGLSAARNAGLDRATGEYVAFVDSDDVVLTNYIGTLYDLADRYQADIVACDYVKCLTEDLSAVKKELLNINAGRGEHGSTAEGIEIPRGWSKKQGSDKEISMSSTQMLRQWHGKYKKWETVAWNKLYRRSIFEGTEGNFVIRFPTARRHEDVLSSHLFVANATHIAMTMRKLYLYRVRPGSITDQSVMTEFREENLCAQRDRIAFFKERRYWRAYFNLLLGYVLHLAWFSWKRVK